MELQTVKAVIERGTQGRVQFNIAQQLGITQTVVAYIMTQHRNGKNPNWILEQLNKGAGQK